jgi:hypothetical protein
MVAAQQRAIGGHAADAMLTRDRPRRAQRFLSAPEMEMLQRPLGQILALRYRLRADIALHQDAVDVPLAEFDRKTETNGPASNDENLGVWLVHFIFDWLRGRRRERFPVGPRRAAADFHRNENRTGAESRIIL